VIKKVLKVAGWIGTKDTFNVTAQDPQNTDANLGKEERIG